VLDTHDRAWRFYQVAGWRRDGGKKRVRAAAEAAPAATYIKAGFEVVRRGTFFVR
jgi:hypothetical protein